VDKDLTAYHRLQVHAAFAFGIATSGDVPQIMFYMPNATAQLMVGRRLVRGVFFFSPGIRVDVFRDLFSIEDVLWQ
jgi:hypothetical protein